MAVPTPHLEKLNSTLANEKLPRSDKPRIKAAIVRYQKWINDLEAVTGTPQERVQKLVELLNEYRLYIDLEVVFDSPQDFLYRQKGQLKLDNSVIEEFLPHLVQPAILPEIEGHEVVVGPTTCFSSIYFSVSLEVPVVGGGLDVRAKDQDFAISKKLFLKASHDSAFEESYETNFQSKAMFWSEGISKQRSGSTNRTRTSDGSWKL